MEKHYYVKTAAGRDEVQSKSRKLARSARSLLVIIDAARPADDWLHLIHGASPQELEHLLAEGLIERTTVVPASAKRERVGDLQQALGSLSYEQLYTLLTSQAKERLGLIRGFKMILEVERCDGIEQLQQLAVRFVGLVREEQGEEPARQMRMALGCAA